MKRIAALLILIALIGLIEFTSIAQPIERAILRVSALLLSTVNEGEERIDGGSGQDTVRALLYSNEIAELKRQLNYRERSAMTVLSASVSGYSTDPSRSLFLLDRGSRDGITKGAPVVAGDGILIGIVHELDAESSMVMPLHDPRSSVLVRIPREDEDIHGIARGRFNVGADLMYVPITEEMRVGDIVVTSGLQEGIPSGLVLGTVQEVRKNQQDLFQSAILEMPYAAYPPLNVLVVTTYETD